MKLNKEHDNIYIVIGGGSFHGKSLIALKIATMLELPLIISTDTVRNFLHVSYPKSDKYTTSTYLMSNENLILQMQGVSDMIKSMMTIYNKRGESAIIEGMHLSPEFIKYASKESNIIAFALDNKISMADKIRHKFNTTRTKLEYFDTHNKQTVFMRYADTSLMESPYMNHADRIQEIHYTIISNFRKNNLPVIEFTSLNEGITAAINFVNNYLSKYR